MGFEVWSLNGISWGCNWIYGNKATGWLAAIARVINLNLRCSRLRDKMLVFVGLVKKCLQHGHSFRLAGVWLKLINLHFARAVNQFCSSSAEKTYSEFIIFKFPMQTSTRLSINFLSPRSISAKVLSAKLTATKYGSRMQPPRARQTHVNNGNKFRGPCVILVKNVITPPPPPTVDHKRACATC